MADRSLKACPACLGSGECPECRGLGGTEHECFECGHMHECDCPGCDNTGKCEDCHGKGTVVKTDFDLESEGQLNLLQKESGEWTRTAAAS